jgi:hypothetical protein
MGCDIHLFAEKKMVPKWGQFWKSPKWVSIDKYTRNPDFGQYEGEREFEVAREDRIYTDGRNYNLFCALAGVRSYQFTGEPPVVSEPKGLPDDCCPEIIQEAKNWGSDGHTHSWLTLKEMEDFDWSPYGATCDDFMTEVFSKLRDQSSNPENVRIVFWFDN